MEQTSLHSQQQLVKLRQFTCSDLEEISLWFESRDMVTPTMEDLPCFGLIAEAVYPIAVGFLIETDTNHCVIDFFSADPSEEKHIRNVALDLICDGLVAAARSKGYSKIKCDTQLDIIKKRALKHGCAELGEFSVFLKEL